MTIMQTAERGLKLGPLGLDGPEGQTDRRIEVEGGCLERERCCVSQRHLPPDFPSRLLSPASSVPSPSLPPIHVRARLHAHKHIFTHSHARTRVRTHKQASSSRSLPRHRASSTPSHPSRRPRLPSWPAAATPTPTACSTLPPPPAPPSALPSRPPPEPAAPSSTHKHIQGRLMGGGGLKHYG